MACVVSAVSGLIYGNSVSDFLTSDSIDHAVSIVRGPWQRLLHPHHLLYNVLGRLFLGLTDSHIANHRALHLLQYLNVATSTIAVGIFYLVARRLIRSHPLGLVLTGVFAFSNSFWAYSTQNEVYHLTVLCLLVSLLLVLRESKLAWIPISLAMLMHQTAVFFVVGMFVHTGMRGGSRWIREQLFWLNTVLPVLIVGLCYWVADWLMTSRMTFGSVWRFATAYAHTGYWGHLSLESPIRFVFGFFNSVLPVGHLRALFRGQVTFAEAASGVEHVILLFSVVSVLALVILAARALLRHRGEVVWPSIAARDCSPLLVGWLVAHLAFVFWWYPSNLEFWIPVLPGLLLLGGCLLEAARGKTVLAFLTIVLCGQLSLGGLGRYREASRVNQFMEFAKTLADAVKSQDLILVTGQGSEIHYLQYFLNTRVVGVQPFAPGAEMKTEAILDALRSEIELAMARRGSVIATKGFVSGHILLDRQLEAFEMDKFIQFIRSYQWVPRTSKGFDYYLLARELSRVETGSR